MHENDIRYPRIGFGEIAIIILSQSSPATAGALGRFYQAHRGEIASRPDRVLKETAENGQVTCLLDKNAEVIAASAYFVYTIDGKMYVELGATLISSLFRGYGLHSILLALRLGTLRFLEGEDTIFSVIEPDNVISQGTVSKWLHNWPDPSAKLLKERASFSDNQVSKLFLKYSREQDIDLAKQLLEYKEIHYCRHRDPNRQGIEIHLSHPLVASPTWQNHLRELRGQIH